MLSLLKSSGRCLFPLLFLATIFIQACYSPAKINRWVDKEYKGVIDNKPRTSNYFTVKAKEQWTDDALSKSEKRKTQILPFLLFWKWKYGTSSTLNPAVPQWYLNSAIVSYANTKRLRDKLDGG